jgi:hypothetical protein
MNYTIIPIKVKIANEFIEKYHRHNRGIDHRSHRFSLGLMCDDKLIGVAVAGLPIAQKNDDGFTLEILRVCVLEGYPNANSMLYARIKRIALLMGYRRIITYTLKDELGSSLKAIGAVPYDIRIGKWSRPARPRTDQLITFAPKIRWELTEAVK